MCDALLYLTTSCAAKGGLDGASHVEAGQAGAVGVGTELEERGGCQEQGTGTADTGHKSA